MVGGPRKLTKAVLGLALLLGVALALGVALLLPATAAATAKPRPVVTSISPAKGPALGGTTVTIVGRNFRVGGRNVVRAVRFGSKSATKIHVVSATKLRCRAPRAVGVVNVRVVTKVGTSAARSADHFAYQGGPPVVSAISPAYGPAGGGTLVTLTGSGFKGATEVTFVALGSEHTATFKVASDNSITATAPAQDPLFDPYDVRVKTPLGTSPATSMASSNQAVDEFNYYAVPTVTSVSPANGSQLGGTAVTITGNYLLTARNLTGSIKFGAVAATNVKVKSNTTVTATAPAGAGTVDVTVTTFGGTSVTSPKDEFSYATTVAATGVWASGPTPSAAAGEAVGAHPGVLVTDDVGAPVAGVAVTFAVALGSGSVNGGTTQTVPTDASGIATAGSWTLGTSLGDNTITATCAGLAPVTLHATTVVGTGVNLVVNAGDGQKATVATAVATPPSVQVTDAHGYPVSGVNVTFAVASGGGSVNGATTQTVQTDASGIATSSGWTLGPTINPIGGNQLTASGSGLTPSSVTFTATATVGAAADIAAYAGDGQNATVATAVATPPSVQVTDAHGNPVGGVSVTFAVAPGGGSVNGDTTQTVQTDASGIATSGGWTLGASPGDNQLTATSDSLSGSPVTFTATATVGAAADIAAYAGDGQNATVATAVATPPSVQVTDAHGNPVGGVSVTFAVAPGSGSVNGDTTQTVQTDASGIATSGGWTLGGTAGSNTLTATSDSLSGSPVTFHATGTADSAFAIVLVDGDGQTAASGSAVATDPSVEVTDSYGNPVSGVSVTFDVTAGNGSVTDSSVTTDGSGLASVGWTLGDPGTNTMTATADSLSGSPVTFTATAE